MKRASPMSRSRRFLDLLSGCAAGAANFSVATNIITEASLSFLGLGVEPTIPTWGSMLADGRAYIGRAWWLTTFPGLAILFTVLSINILGDALRDHLDPRLRKL